MISLDSHPDSSSRKLVRGEPYTLAEFTERYGLDEAKALRLFTKFGPSSVDLDAFMAARDRRQLVQIFLAM
jgi:hypothetical protein